MKGQSDHCWWFSEIWMLTVPGRETGGVWQEIAFDVRKTPSTSWSPNLQYNSEEFQKFLPKIVTAVPPIISPCLGLISEKFGYSNCEKIKVKKNEKKNFLIHYNNRNIYWSHSQRNQSDLYYLNWVNWLKL